MRLTQGEVQLLKSGPWGSQYPSGPTHIYEATPKERRQWLSENSGKNVNDDRAATAMHALEPVCQYLCVCVCVFLKDLLGDNQAKPNVLILLNPFPPF